MPEPIAPETTANATAPTANEGKETPKTYTEEEFNRAKQSASSMAKNEILKDLGISSVEQGKALFQSKSDSEKKISDLEASVKALTEKSERAEEDAEIARSGVDGKRGEDLKVLAKSKMKDGLTFSQAVAKTLEENPYWKTQNPPPFGPTVKADPSKAMPPEKPSEKW